MPCAIRRRWERIVRAKVTASAAARPAGISAMICFTRGAAMSASNKLLGQGRIALHNGGRGGCVFAAGPAGFGGSGGGRLRDHPGQGRLAALGPVRFQRGGHERERVSSPSAYRPGSGSSLAGWRSALPVLLMRESLASAFPHCRSAGSGWRWDAPAAGRCRTSSRPPPCPHHLPKIAPFLVIFLLTMMASAPISCLACSRQSVTDAPVKLLVRRLNWPVRSYRSSRPGIIVTLLIILDLTHNLRP